MKAWQLLKHLEEGGRLDTGGGHTICLGDLSGWDYDPIRNPEGYTIILKEETDEPIETNGAISANR